jgi:hypothetical protein
MLTFAEAWQTTKEILFAAAIALLCCVLATAGIVAMVAIWFVWVGEDAKDNPGIGIAILMVTPAFFLVMCYCLVVLGLFGTWILAVGSWAIRQVRSAS